MTYNWSASVQGGNESLMCSYPVGLDPYRRGCGNDCLYCYVRHRTKDIGAWKPEDPTSLNLKHLRKLFEDVFVRNKTNSQAQKTLKTKLPLRIGMNTDPFQDVERERKVTKGLLEILREFKYPYLLLTKNRMVADDEYLRLFDPDISYIQITITSLNDAMSKRIETNASLPRERLEALKRLRECRIRTAARINPLFPIYQDGAYSFPETLQGSDKLDVFSLKLVQKICDCKPSTLIAGFLRLDSEKTHRWLEEGANLNLRPFFRKHGSHRYYSKNEIRYYYEECKKICQENNIAFTVCYDQNANYECFRDMWANQKDCCNALGQTKFFGKTYRMISDNFKD